MNSNEERRGRASHRGSASVRRAGTHSGVNKNADRAGSIKSDIRPAETSNRERLQGTEKYRQQADRNERPSVSISRTSQAENIRRNSAGANRNLNNRTSADINKTPSNVNKSSSNVRRNNGSGKNKKNKNAGIIAVTAGVIVIALVIFGMVKIFSGRKEPEINETVDPHAITHEAVIDLSLITGETNDIAVNENEAEDESDIEASKISDPSKLYIKGMTLEEIKSAINKKYEWNLKIVNGSASVGEKVKPTVDANETTEAATMGDAENPDSILKTNESFEEEPREITVSNEIHIPDIIAVGLDRLISEISENEQSFRDEQVSKEAESETAKSKKKKKKNEDETESPATEYKLELPDYEKTADEVISKAELMWYKAPKGGGIGSYDKENDKFIMEGAEDGFKVNSDELRNLINEAIDEGRYTESIQVPGEVLKTDMKAVQAEYKTLAEFSTTTTNNSVRNKNIKIACEKLNGTIVKPGEEFSFNDAVGERTPEAGYGAAAAYNNGEVVQEVGGGVCQLSTTLYNAVLRAGLKTTKRQSHTFKPTYVTPGWDATISWGGPDYRFANVPSREEYSNDKSYAIGIRAHYADNKVTVSIYGRPVLKDGYSYDLESKKIKDIDIVRKLIEEGSGRTPTAGSMGSQWSTDLIIKKNGEEIKREYDHKTYYSGHIQYYLEEVPTESTSESVSESASESDSDITVTGPDGGPGVVGDDNGSIFPINPIKPSDNNETPQISQGNDGPMTEPKKPSIETFPVKITAGFIDID